MNSFNHLTSFQDTSIKRLSQCLLLHYQLLETKNKPIYYGKCYTITGESYNIHTFQERCKGVMVQRRKCCSLQILQLADLLKIKRQCECKYASPTRIAFNPDFSTMSFNKFFADYQT
jgi:hypothetical protein